MSDGPVRRRRPRSRGHRGDGGGDTQRHRNTARTQLLAHHVLPCAATRKQPGGATTHNPVGTTTNGRRQPSATNHKRKKKASLPSRISRPVSRRPAPRRRRNRQPWRAIRGCPPPPPPPPTPPSLVHAHASDAPRPSPLPPPLSAHVPTMRPRSRLGGSMARLTGAPTRGGGSRLAKLRRGGRGRPGGAWRRRGRRAACRPHWPLPPGPTGRHRSPRGRHAEGPPPCAGGVPPPPPPPGLQYPHPAAVNRR